MIHLKFYTLDIWPFAHRVTIAMREVFGKDQSTSYTRNVEKVVIDLKNKPEWYLKVNTNGKAPSLQINDGRIFIESAVIAEYIAEKYGNNNPLTTIYPNNDLERRSVVSVEHRMIPVLFQQDFYLQSA